MKSCCRAHIFTMGDTLKHPRLAGKADTLRLVGEGISVEVVVGELADVVIAVARGAPVCRFKTLRAVPHEPIASSDERVLALPN